MNILVIGNGFDLAHGLPTKYTHFLEFIQLFLEYYEMERNSDSKCKYWVDNNEMKLHIKELFDHKYNDGDPIKNMKNKSRRENAKELIQEFHNLIKDNFWIEYFLQCNMYQKENWIDFENEISKVIQSLDNDMQNRINGAAVLDDEIDIMLSNDILDPYTERYGDITFKALRDLLLNDLNKLIRAFEIYLCEYVEKIEIEKKSPDIDGLEVDFILSFNYTHIFSKLYDVSILSKQEAADPFDYIHGEANINNTIETNNMVLGIDEYLSDDRKNKDVEFIAFKKYYQRIHKQTGCKYKEWLDKIRQDYLDYLQKIETTKYKELQYVPDTTQRLFNKYAMLAIKYEKCEMHNLYIFGHSLDVTDKDILRELILNDNVYTTIFYHDKDTMGQQIANLVKVIGQDELIRRTGGNTKTIEFKLQQPMEDIKQKDS